MSMRGEWMMDGQGLQSMLARLCWIVFAGVTVFAIFATLSMWIDTGSWDGRILLLAAFSAILGAGFAFRKSTIDAANALGDGLDRIPRLHFILLAVVFGLALRIGWLLFAGTEPWSDYRAYWELAKLLSDGEPYFFWGRYAYFPPGLPLLLTPFVLLIGKTYLTYIVFNLILFLLACAVLWRLALMLFDERVARMALFLLVIWPNYWMLANLPNKETVLVALLPLSVLLYFLSLRAPRPATHAALAIAAGVVVGISALCQPTALLFVSVFFFFELLFSTSASRSVARLAIVCVAVGLTVMPWLVRNYQVLGVVAFSSGAGEGLFNGAHDGSTGGWSTVIRERNTRLSHLSEKEQSDALRKEAIDWIKNNPAAFAVLAVKKQIRLLGDDVSGAYSSLSPPDRPPARAYAVLSWVSNLFWLLLMVVILWSFLCVRRMTDAPASYSVIFALHLLYFVALHSIFQSESRHKVSAYIPLAILAASVVQEGRVRRGSVAPTVASGRASER